MPKIKDKTWPEIRELAERGACIVIPTGATEQHGPHLPIKTDAYIVEAVCERAVEKVEAQGVSVALAPCLTLGCSDHHLAYFALSVDTLLYTKIIMQLGFSAISAGFKRILFVNGHGGNGASIQCAIREIRKQTPVLVGAVNYWSLASAEIEKTRNSPTGAMSHAGEFETSLMLYLNGETVNMERAVESMPRQRPGYLLSDLIRSGPVGVATLWQDVSESGILGNPLLASAEKGKRFFEASVDGLELFLRDYSGWSLTAETGLTFPEEGGQ